MTLRVSGFQWNPSPHRRAAAIRRPEAPPRLTIHTTETDPGTMAAVHANLEWPYTFALDPARKVAQQWLEADGAAYALVHPTGTPETNHMGRRHPQVVIVGRAANMHTLPNDQLEWLAAKIGPILDACDIPNRWLTPYRAGHQGWTLASPNSPARMSWNAWGHFTGVCCHQHVPGNDHWDPGGLDVSRLQALIEDAHRAPAPTCEEQLDALRERNRRLTTILAAARTKSPKLIAWARRQADQDS